MKDVMQSDPLIRMTDWMDWPKPFPKPTNPYLIGVIEGEGIGPEIIKASLSMIPVIEQCTSLRFDIRYGGEIGNTALKKYGTPLTSEVIDFCSTVFAEKGAVFCGPGGGRFVYDLRQHFAIYCKMVPIQPMQVLSQVGPIKPNLSQCLDILVIRENLGGLYQGECQLETINGKQRAIHTFSYNEQQIDNLLIIAIRAAQSRQKKLCVVTKPGGASSVSALWKARAELLSNNQGIELNFLEVDNAAYQIVAHAAHFDVIAAPNLFGDVIADVGALLLGARGLSYSANYGHEGIAVYQTGHGAAYDLMGKNQANPLGQLFSFAMMLHESFGLTCIAEHLRASIQIILERGWRTADIMESGCQEVTTSKMATLIAEQLRLRLMRNVSGNLIQSVNVVQDTISKKTERLAFLLIDMQNDFLDRLPDDSVKVDLIKKSVQLVAFCRKRNIPIIHIHTNSGPDGKDAMPHWQEKKYHACIENTKGILAHSLLLPESDDPIIYKRGFNPFHHPDLHQILQFHGVDCVLIAGLYLHACVRSTATEAYERGYQVWVASDAVGSTEPLHAELSRVWLSQRVARFYTIQEITQKLGGNVLIQNQSPTLILPVANILNQWLIQTDLYDAIVNQNPSNQQQTLSIIPVAGADKVSEAARVADSAWKRWRQTELLDRVAFLEQWELVMRSMYPSLLQLLMEEIGKPRFDAEEELNRTFDHFQYTISSIKAGCYDIHPQLCYPSVGCCALITPWNNPIAIPVSKLAPALLFGNTVVWKPSPLVPQLSMLIMNTLIKAGLPQGVVGLLFGNQETVRQLILKPEIKAVTITGSVQTGRRISDLCHLLEKPIQAELGGNNACIILADADLETAIHDLTLAAFSFSGQRCTAIRRFIVEEAIVVQFKQLMTASIKTLRLGNPFDSQTKIGPVVNESHLLRIRQAIDNALLEGATLLCGGKMPHEFCQGCWWEPTLLADVLEYFKIVQEETFGPVAVIQTAKNIEDAVRLANNVPHGLLAGILTNDQDALTYFKSHIEAGILKISSKPLAIQPELPFGGWKASRQGPPEHGQWDQLFYSRVQTIYE